MKRYILLSAMLVIALNLCAQSTNTGRTTRQRSSTGSAVKENKNSEETRKAEVKKERTEERKVERTDKPSSTRESETRTTTRTRTSGRENPAVERNSNKSVTPERKRETTVTREREVNTGNNRREVTTVPDRNSRSVERPVERKVTRENKGERVRVEKPEGTVTTKRSTTNLNNREYVPRNEREFAERRKTYVTPERRVVVRTITNPTYVHRPVEYRRTYYPYKVPIHRDIIWDIHLYNEYCYLYPHYDYWYYPIGYRVHTVSAYDADRYIGEFARIYGKVFETWFDHEADEVYLYFGDPYPYQDFTVILTGRDARRFSRRPERFFTGRYIAVTGVVSVFEGKPEMVIKRRSQVELYF